MMNGVCSAIMNAQPVANVLRAALGDVTVNGAPSFFTISTDSFFTTIRATVIADNTTQQCDGGFVVLNSIDGFGIIPKNSQFAFSVPSIACITTPI